jgi:hypothetical protein
VLGQLRLQNRLARWRRGEAGFGEVATTIVVLPFMASLIFLLLEVGFNIHYRSGVDSIVQNTVRGIALEGGDSNLRTHASGASPWTVQAGNTLATLCGGTIGSNSYPNGRCKRIPTINCPGTQGSVPTGTEFSCTATFYYAPISPMSTNPLWSMGMSGLFTKPITITVNSTVSGGA